MPKPPSDIPLGTTSLKCSNFKCFAQTPYGFERIKPINVIIGRNNTGKTTLLDLIEYATKPSSSIQSRGHRGSAPEVTVSFPLSDTLLSQLTHNQIRIRNENTGAGFNISPKDFADRQQLKGVVAAFELTNNNNLSYRCLPTFTLTHPDQAPIFEHIGNAIADQATNPFWGFTCRRIVADRDVIPESSSDSLDVNSNGRGLTNVFQRYINHSMRDRDLVEKALLRELNNIFRPDAEYTRLLVQQHGSEPTSHWELYLEEDKKGRIPMSQTGSGLKTVLLVLANLLLVPQITDKDLPLSKYLFCFEELENNLHPAVQRRLFRYLLDRAAKSKCHFFITTHSNVVIDLFANDPNAQILHVTHDGESASVRSVETMEHGHGILDDLDMRASDLLQTNVVVWVEGPSDAIYFNRWIELWTQGMLVEGIHYQCLPVGGSCGSHFSFDSEEAVKRLIPALRINRHAILLADSDKSVDTDDFKANTQRLAEEVNKSGYAWLTKGREVENYIPASVFPIVCNDPALKGPGQFTKVLDYVAEKKGIQTKPAKVDLAREVAPHLTRDAIKVCLDMGDHLNRVCEFIRQWNRLESPKNTPQT